MRPLIDPCVGAVVDRGMSMVKSELVQRISDPKLHLYERDVARVVDAMLEEIVAALARGDRVELRGFGIFSVKVRQARTGRNPRTGAMVTVGQDGDSRSKGHSVL